MSPSEKQSPQKDITSWKESPFLILKGFLMGSADIVPGVSGGTMALIVGIYNRLIHAISSFDLQFLKLFFTFQWKHAFRRAHWKFMTILLGGIFCAILFFTRVVPLQTYMFTDPELIFGIFFGLIVGSIFILIKAIDDFSWRHGVFVAVGFAFGLWVVTRVPADTPETALFVFLSGSVAICAMVLPGISGSYILLILHKYEFILTQLSKLGTAETGGALWILGPFILGAVVGLMLFTRTLAWLLDHYYTRTLALLIGFLIGSLYIVWPYQNRTYQEIVPETEVVALNSERAQALRANPPSKNQPEYQRLGDIINPGPTSKDQKQVEIETVKQKLVRTDPFIPYLTAGDAGTPHFWKGIISMVIGLLMVVGLDYIGNE